MTRHHATTVVLFSVTVLILIFTSSAYAIPAFSRQYGTSCSTCHLDFPKLNDFGKAFKDAGFKFPKDDESFIKIPPVMLGAPAQKELWPHSIWPGTIPGMPQIGLRMNTFFQVYGSKRNAFNEQLAAGMPGAVVPTTDFQPGLFSIFTAGNFGSDIAFWVDDDFSVGGANSNGGLGDGYLKFVNIGRLLKLPEYALSLRVGQFELDLPFSQARTWNLSGWDIFDVANFGTANQNVNNITALSAAAQGVEFSGGRTYRGYHYSLAIINQNTTNNLSSAPTVSPEVGIFSDSSFKDIYARVSYRFNLEKDPASRNEIQAAGASGPRDHTYIDFGGFYFYGRSVQRYSETPTVVTSREPFYRVGGNFSFNYRTFNLFGVYLVGHDQDLIPVIPAGGAIPTSFMGGTKAQFSGGFLEADYVALPWLMAIMRWDSVNSKADQLNGIGEDAGNLPANLNFVSPFNQNRNRFTPGVQFLIHANIKASFEYQVRPKQVVYAPGTVLALTSPFRTNSAVAGLEWVY